MLLFHDQLNTEINLSAVPRRIISIVPSQTELLYYLGLDEEIIGITRFCIHPADKFKSTVKVGGTKQLDIAKIKGLKPDHIIANKEENERGQVEALATFCPVWISDVNDLPSAVDMIERVGALVDRKSEADILSNAITDKFNRLTLPLSELRVAYFIWRNPYMVAGANTFIDSMLQQCGLINVFEQERYPEIDAKQLMKANPDVILLSSEPYPFKEKHIAELKSIVSTARIMLVDGEMFSWYGSRLLYAPNYFGQLVSQLNH